MAEHKLRGVVNDKCKLFNGLVDLRKALGSNKVDKSGGLIMQSVYIYIYLSSIFVCLVNKFLNFQGIFLSQFRCGITLEYATVRIRSRGDMNIILLSLCTQVFVLVRTDVN